MGVGVSTNVIQASEVTNIINEQTLQSVQRCGGTSVQNQELIVNGDNNVISNIFLNQNSTFNFSCFGNSENQVNLFNGIDNAITTKAQSNSELVLGLAFAQNFTFNTVTTNALNETLVQTIQQCAVGNQQTQALQINGNFNQVVGVTFNQFSEIFSQCVFDSQNLANISNQITNDINAESTAQAGSSFVGIIVIVAIVIIVIVIVILVAIMVTGVDKTTIEKGLDAAVTSRTGVNPGISNKPTPTTQSTLKTAQSTANKTTSEALKKGAETELP